MGALIVAAAAVFGAVWCGWLAACWLTASRPRVLLAGVCTTRRQRARYRNRRRGDGRLVRSRVAQRSSAVGARLDRVVMWADRGRCVVCGEPQRMVQVGRSWQRFVVVDHVWPWAGGGLSWLPNGAALCRPHNSVKSNYSVDADGFVHMHVRANIPAAAAILAAERAARRSPARWVRLAIGLVLA